MPSRSPVHLDVPPDVFLAQVVAGAGTLKGVRVEQPTESNVTIHHCNATLIWFIHRNDVVSVIAKPDPGGCLVTVSGRGPQRLADLLDLLLDGEAERNYAMAT